MAEHSMIGYHGTTKENAENILFTQYFIPSNKPNEWLGDGAYFFSYLSDAREWLTHQRFRNKETAVVTVDLLYSDEQLLDLDDPAQMTRFEEAIAYASERIEKVDGVLPFDLQSEDWHRRTCFAVNWYRAINPQIGIIIYTFSKPQVTLLFRQTQRQICVSNQTIIHNIRMEGDRNA